MARVAYMAGGMYGRVGGAYMARGHTWQGACMAGGKHGRVGACMAGRGNGMAGMHGRGHVWQEGMHGRGLCVAGETAAAAGGTHHTGMHSCHLKRFPFFWGRKKT